ncbi:DNA/RNA non-specific endonuclease [Patulibacter sp. NPDC049589]|uniref:DNA/RNA non-specific endonuclease n=1 Tax=Patulibacter sp. NPDC049589 TaxID=3154731 RepID=UPI00342F332F
MLAPLGGRLYDNGNPGSQFGGPGTIVRWQVPGASRITNGVFSTLRYRNENDDQYLRVRLFGAPGVDKSQDFGPAYDQASPTTTYSLPTTTLTPPDGGGTTAEAWLFTVCHPDPPGPDVYACPNIPSGTGTFGRIGKVELTLDDPDDPQVDVASAPQIDDGWVNKRRAQKLTVTATDPSSGIQRIRTQLRLGTSTRTLNDTTVSCDPDHRTTGRGGLVCPATASAAATDRATDSSTKDRTYVVTVWDHAGNQTVKTLVVRRDVTKPTSGTIGGQLNAIARKWTNRSDTIPVTVRARDAQSGVGRVDLTAQRVGSGTTIPLGSTVPPCDRGCKSTSSTVPVDLSKLDHDGRYRLKLRVTDRAGNTRTFTVGPQLKIDRRAPIRIGPGAYYTIIDETRIRVTFSPGRDPSDGAGLGDVVVRYWPAPGPGPSAEEDEPGNREPSTDEFGEPRARAAARRGTDAEPRFRQAAIRSLRAPDATLSRFARVQRTMVVHDPDGIDFNSPVGVLVFDKAIGFPDPGLRPLVKAGNARVENQATLRQSRPQRPSGGGGGRIPSAPSARTGAPNWEGRNRLTQAQREADFPGRSGNGGSRGNTPQNYENGLAGNESRAPRKQPTNVLSKYPNNNRTIHRPKDGSAWSNPWPMMDAWPRDTLGRALGARMRGERARVVEEGRDPVSPVRRYGKVDRTAREKVPLLRDYRDRRCRPLTAGHLIGTIFGGYGDDPRNLVPLTQADNNRMRAQIEDPIRRIVEANRRAGAHFVYYVRVEYNADGKYPAHVRAYVQLAGGRMNDGATKFSRDLGFTTRDGRTLRRAGGC